MNIAETDDWVPAVEAARLLGVSRQRVNMLGNEGMLDVIRPWTRVQLVSRRSIAERLAVLSGSPGPIRLSVGTVRRFVRERTGERYAEKIDDDTLRDLCLEFITDARSVWPQPTREAWAHEMLERIRAGDSDHVEAFATTWALDRATNRRRPTRDPSHA